MGACPRGEASVVFEVPPESRLLDVARQAARQGMLLATNGQRALMARRVPPGWTRIRTNIKRGIW